MLGSRAYVQSLSEEERSKISAVFVDDSGTNQQASLTCAENMEAMLRQVIEPMNFAFPEVPIQLNVQPRMPARGGASGESLLQTLPSRTRGEKKVLGLSCCTSSSFVRGPM